MILHAVNTSGYIGGSKQENPTNQTLIKVLNIGDEITDETDFTTMNSGINSISTLTDDTSSIPQEMSTSLASKMKRLDAILQPIEEKIKTLELQLENKNKGIEEKAEFLKESKAKEKAYVADKDEAQAYIEELITFYDFDVKEPTSTILKEYVDTQEQREKEEQSETEDKELVNAELYSICRTACLDVNIKMRYIDKQSEKIKTLENEISTLKKEQEDLTKDIKKFGKERDIAKRNAFLELYEIDVGKLSLSETILDPELKKDVNEIIRVYQNPDAAKEEGVYVPEGLLLQGPEGVGKCNIAKIIASETGYKVIRIKEQDMVVFPHIATTLLEKVEQEKGQYILLLDGMGRVCSTLGNRATANSLLEQMDMIRQSKLDIKIVVTIHTDHGSGSGKTENILIDPRFLTHKLLETQLFIPLPSEQERKDLFKMYTKESVSDEIFKDLDFAIVAEKTKGFSQQEIRKLIHISRRKKFTNNINMQEGQKIAAKDEINTDFFSRTIDILKEEKQAKEKRIGFIK